MAFAPRGNRGRRPQIPGKGDWQRGGQQQRPQPSLGELYQDAWQSARDANEDRYGQILGGYNQLEDQAGGRLGGLLGGYAGMGSRLGGLSTQNLGAINALMNKERGGILDRAEQRQGDVQDRFGEFGQQHQDLIGRGRQQHLGGLAARTGGLLGGRQGAMDRMQQAHQGRSGGMMDILRGAGDTERERIGRQFDQAQEAQSAQAEQDLISRGLGNTTIRSSVMGGIGDRTQQGKADAMNRLAEQLRGERLGAFERGTGAELAQLGRDLEGISMAGERLTGDQMGALERGNIRREGADMQVGMAGLGQLSDAQRAMGQMDFGLGQQGMGGLINTLGANLSGQLNLGQSALSALERGGQNVQGIGQDMLNFMERRDDQYPDIGQLIELASGAGQSGMGMGGGIGAPQFHQPFGNPYGGGGWMYRDRGPWGQPGGGGGTGGGGGGTGGGGGGGLEYDDYGTDTDYGSGDADGDGVPDYLDPDTGPQAPPPTGGGGGPFDSPDPWSPDYDPFTPPGDDGGRPPYEGPYRPPEEGPPEEHPPTPLPPGEDMGLPEGPWSPGPGEDPYVPSPFPLPPGEDMGLPQGPWSPGPGGDPYVPETPVPETETPVPDNMLPQNFEQYNKIMQMMTQGYGMKAPGNYMSGLNR